jgi:hypothetical protein
MSDHDATKVFKLSKPIGPTDAKISAITIREPMAQDIEMAEKMSVAENKGVLNSNTMAIQLIAILGSQTVVNVRNLGAKDYMKIRGHINTFLEDSPATAENSAPT